MKMRFSFLFLTLVLFPVTSTHHVCAMQQEKKVQFEEGPDAIKNAIKKAIEALEAEAHGYAYPNGQFDPQKFELATIWRIAKMVLLKLEGEPDEKLKAWLDHYYDVIARCIGDFCSKHELSQSLVEELGKAESFFLLGEEEGQEKNLEEIKGQLASVINFAEALLEQENFGSLKYRGVAGLLRSKTFCLSAIALVMNLYCLNCWTKIGA